MSTVFNIAKGKVGYYATLPATNDAIVAVLIKSTGLEADDTLNNYTSLSALLAGTNDEADFTSYVRKTLTTAITASVDNTNNWLVVVSGTLSWLAAGGATNNTLGKIIFCYDPDTTTGTDADLIPLTAHDITASTDGNDLNVSWSDATAAFFKAA